MRTVKQVSDLTGISIRTLHYYDEIGLLKPSEVTDAGYRLYDDEALKVLQQILFFKELDISLKEVKEIMLSPYFDKMQALKKQKKLLIIKRNRLNGLIDVINKTLKGEGEMNFKEFDMSEYYNALEEIKKEHKDNIIKSFGSIEKYNELIEKCKSKETEIAKDAIKQYGSIKKYVKAMKNNFNSRIFHIEEQNEKFRKDFLEDNNPKLSELYKKITDDLSKDPHSEEIQKIAKDITYEVKKNYDIFSEGDYWYYMVQSYIVFPQWIEKVDNKYKKGASKFIGESLKYYIGDDKPKLEKLYEKLTADLSKDPHSEEIQKIVKEIDVNTRKQNESMGIDEGENYLGYMSDFYLSKHDGISKFIGEALKFYSENNKA